MITESQMKKIARDLASRDARLAKVIEAHPLCTLGRNPKPVTHFEALVESVISQQLQAEVTRDVYQAALTREGIGEIVTEIKSADGVPYFLAEEYHQKYLQKNPNGYDCHSSTGVAFPALA